MLSVKLAKETYCRDETDPIKQTGGPDFETESWISFIYLDLNPTWARGSGGRALKPMDNRIRFIRLRGQPARR